MLNNYADKKEYFFKILTDRYKEEGWSESRAIEEVIEARWDAIIRCVNWIDASPHAANKAAVVWKSGEEPECFWHTSNGKRSHDLYSLDDYDYVAIFPPDYGWTTWEEHMGANSTPSIDLPNGWRLVVGYHS